MNDSLIMSFGVETIQVLRKRLSGEWLKGRWAEEEIKTIEDIRASVQQMNAHEVLLLPEARRTRESIKVYTTTKLETANEEQGREADVLLYDGNKYEIHQIANWAAGTDFPHYKIIATRMDREEDEGIG